jgi:hypothetical protein
MATVTITTPPSAQARPPRLLPAGLLFAGSLVPALFAVLPLTLKSSWYLQADENAPYLDTATVLWMLGMFAIGLAPFLAAAVALTSVLLTGASLARALQIAAGIAIAFGCLAFMAGMASSGGF